MREDMVRRIALYGVGINDVDYVTQPTRINEFGIKTTVVCPYYASWRRMLERVYSEKEHARNPWTVGNSVSGEWHSLSTFKSWMETQIWEGLELDKDILVRGNKHYSPETCAFVPAYLNSLFGYQQRWRKELPFGVARRSRKRKDGKEWTNPYISRCCIGNKQDFKHLGYFSSPKEAHKAWQNKKIEQIETTIERYKLELCYREDVELSLRKVIAQLEYEITNNLETTFL